MVLCNPFPNISFTFKENQNTNQNYVTYLPSNKKIHSLVYITKHNKE